MEVRDPIHGNIDLDEAAVGIMDTPEMQRLRYIRQLDLAYLVYPGANHTRLEHSLGTMQVARELFSDSRSGRPSEWAYIGLLHDIGHGPFSHLSEPFLERYLHKSHEQIGVERIKNSEVADLVSDSGISLPRVLAYFRGSERIDIIGGTLGADRIDYLMRDSHYTGVAYGVIDYERLKTRLVLHKGRVAVRESGVPGAEAMLISRYFMHSNVYTHHAKVIASEMLRMAIAECLEGGAFDAKQLSAMCDEQLLVAIENSEVRKAADIVSRIRERRLYKRAYDSDVGIDVDEGEVRRALLKGGFRDGGFVVRLVKLSASGDDVPVVDGDGSSIGTLSKMSPLVKTLMDVMKEKRRLIVACDKKNVARASAILKRLV